MAFSSTARRSITTLLSRAQKASPSPLPLSRAPTAIFSKTSLRFLSSGGDHSPLNDQSPKTGLLRSLFSNWTNRWTKETTYIDGCDFEHWLVDIGFPEPKPSEDDMVDAYVKTLAQVVGSEEEAKKRIYSVSTSTSTYTGFGCLISEEQSNKLKELPEVLWILPDSYVDVANKDYGGDLYVEGKITRRPPYDFEDHPQLRSGSSDQTQHQSTHQSTPQ